MTQKQAQQDVYDYKIPFVYTLAFAAALLAFEPVFFLGEASLPNWLIVVISIVGFAIATLWATRSPRNSAKIFGCLALLLSIGVILSLTHVTVGSAGRYEALRHGSSTTGTLLSSKYYYGQCRSGSSCHDHIDVTYSFVVNRKTYTNHATANDSTSLFILIQTQGDKHQPLTINYIASNPSINAPLDIL